MNYTKFQNVVLLILRLVVAAVFLYAAYFKISFWSAAPEGMSAFMVVVMKILSIAEPLGALALILGFLTRWAAGGLAIIMLGAIYVMQFTMSVGFVTPTGPGWNFPLIVLAGCLTLIAFGAGRWSIDRFSFLS